MTELAAASDFTRVYRAHAKLAFSAAMRVLGDPATAEDVVQDVFLTLWRSPGNFDPSRGSLPGYIAMMARSRAVDRIRSRKAGAAAADRLAVRDAAPEPAAESPSETVIRRDEAGRLLTVVADLPPVQREAVLLAYGRGLTAAEIAAASGVPLGTAKSRLRLGLQRARRALATASPAAA